MLTAFVPEAWTDRLLGCRQLVVRDLYTATIEWPARTCFIEKNAFAVAAAADGADRQTPAFPQSRIYSANTTPAKTNCANWLRAMARNTAFTYRNNQPDAKQIGRELGVRYLLEGSVQRSGSQVRVNAQLIDAETNAHLWAERFDSDTGNLFALQDEITSRIAVALNLELVGAEAARPTHHPDVLDYILCARAASAKPSSRDQRTEVVGLLERALELEPRSAEAQSWLAGAFAGRALANMTASRAADIERAQGGD